MVNDHWIDMPSFSKVHFIEPGISDHSAMVVKLADLKNVGPKPFKYYTHWSPNEKFSSTVANVWDDRY